MAKFFDNPLLLIVLLLIIILVFGANKLPGAARSLGRSMRIFKSEVKQMNDDEPARHDEAGRPIEGRIVEGPPVTAAPLDVDDEVRRRGA